MRCYIGRRAEPPGLLAPDDLSLGLRELGGEHQAAGLSGGAKR